MSWFIKIITFLVLLLCLAPNALLSNAYAIPVTHDQCAHLTEVLASMRRSMPSDTYGHIAPEYERSCAALAKTPKQK